MRTVAIRVTAIVLVAVLVLAVAVVALGSQGPVWPTPTHRGVPDSPCPPGVSYSQAWCYSTPPPGAPTPSDYAIPQGPGASFVPYVDPS